MSEQPPTFADDKLHPDKDAEITSLAYRFYQEEGFPDGKADEHWLRAEREVQAQSTSPDTQSNVARAENPPLEE
ncbi:MAG TPA: DUF2934 domain-containing protein [Terrimicrobiaceae bacterium]